MRKIALGLAAFLVVASVGKVEAASSRGATIFDNDGRMRASVAGPKAQHHGRRAGRDHRGAGHRQHPRSVTLAGVVPELAIKVRAIVADCGSTVVSAVAGRGNRSNHPGGKAVDLTGNPRCIYAKLEAWPGGVSTDYHSVMCPTRRGWQHCPHVHISYNPNGQEWGRRFAHRNPFRREARVAQ